MLRQLQVKIFRIKNRKIPSLLHGSECAHRVIVKTFKFNLSYRRFDSRWIHLKLSLLSQFPNQQSSVLANKFKSRQLLFDRTSTTCIHTVFELTKTEVKTYNFQGNSFECRHTRKNSKFNKIPKCKALRSKTAATTGIFSTFPFLLGRLLKG